MTEIIVRGGEPLRGEVKVSGSKNAAVALLPAALLADGECVLHNVPDIQDVHVMLDLMRSVGAKCTYADGIALVDARSLKDGAPPPELVGRIRASIYVAGALLARFGHATICLPGGCALNRKIDFHVDAFSKMGARVEATDISMDARCPKGRLRGAKITLDPRWRSVGTTVNVMLAASLADGFTIIENAAREPEVVNCARFLKAMGAKIEGEGDESICIEGVSHLHGIEFSVIPDRMEAGTFLLAGAVSGGSVAVRDIEAEMMKPFLEKLSETGVEAKASGNVIEADGGVRPKAIELITRPFPGFPTDLQPPFVSLLTLAEGKSKVVETIHEGRLKYCEQLCKMGADIVVEEPQTEPRLPCVAWVKGVAGLKGARVWASDLRAGAALILAGLAAEGETAIENAQVVDRGYEQIVEKFQALGAEIQRLETKCEVR